MSQPCHGTWTLHTPRLVGLCSVLAALLCSIGSLKPAQAATKSTNVRLGHHLITPPTLHEAFPDLQAVHAACPQPDSALVIAMAANTKAHKLCPFVRSWQTQSPSTRVVIFTDSPSIVQAYMNSPRSSSNVHVLQVGTRPHPSTKWHFWRYFLYLQFLELCNQLGPLPPVMVSDTRDAIALGDVWSHPLVVSALKQQGVIFALEGNPGAGGAAQDKLAEHDGFGHGGLVTCYKDLLTREQLHALLTKGKYSCSGVTLGAGEAMLEYARAMIHGMLYNASEECWSSHGGDQMVHTWLLNAKLAQLSGQEPDSDLHKFRFRPLPASNGLGPVYSAGLGLPIHMDMFGMVSVTRTNWTTNPLYLHQYDRDDDVAKETKLLYTCALTPTNVFSSAVARGQRMKLEHIAFVVVLVLSGVVLLTTILVLGLTRRLPGYTPKRSNEHRL